MNNFTYEFDNKLEQLLMQNGMEERIQKIVRQVLSEAQKRLSQDARSALPKDPRQACKAVRHSVYKRVLGGNLNILNRRRGSVQMRLIEPPRKLRDGQRGGNRMARSQRTTDLMSYYGKDRGFILRFLNSGTSQRTDKTRGGNRGAIAARNWFPGAAQKEMAQAMERLSQMINDEINKQLQ